ncbi:MAG: SEL1-like repeat protein [Planctomycetia bacterium]|nr:SEL1-like repeat protein [Planctomycetia bacterium]
MTKMRINAVTPEQFDAQFQKIATELTTAPLEQIDQVYARLLMLLSQSEEGLIAFLKRCNKRQLQTALTMLDTATTVQNSPDVIDALKQTQARFPDLDLTASLDAARIAYARLQLLDEQLSQAPGKKDDKSQKEARFNALLAQAQQGDAQAQYRVALHYYFGNGVARDYAQAKLWADKAREQQYEPALLFNELPTA